MGLLRERFLHFNLMGVPDTVIRWWEVWQSTKTLALNNKQPFVSLPFLSLSQSEQCIYVVRTAPRHARNVLNGPSPLTRMLKLGPKLVHSPKRDHSLQSSALTKVHLWGFVTHFHGSFQITCHMFCVCLVFGFFLLVLLLWRGLVATSVMQPQNLFYIFPEIRFLPI